MKHSYIYILSVACLMTSCMEEEFNNEIIPTPGEDVKFSASVDEGVQTRTVYGADKTTGINVYWVDGDKVSVYGTTCTEGRKQAEYKVQTSSKATPNKDNDLVYDTDGNLTSGQYGGHNFADDLVKTGDYGVQWGSAESSDFCAIYPSDGASFSVNGDAIVAHTSIADVQDYVFTECVNSVWQGSHFASDASNPSMQNAIMFARTDDVLNGEQANLHFKPFSTVLKFRLAGYTAGTGLSNPTIYIQNIKITAPDGCNISGNFNLSIEGTGEGATAVAQATGNNSNVITLNTILEGGTYLPLRVGEAVDFNVFTIPLSEVNMGGKRFTDDDGKISCTHPWKVTITTATHGTFEYTILPNEDGKVFTLSPGKVHKIKVPNLHVDSEIEWDPSQWIEQIPVPVYISELSVPGAWYATNDNYQGSIGLGQDELTYQTNKNSNGVYETTTIETPNEIDDGLENLYHNGVRAFNIDCRLTYKSGDSGEMELCSAGSEDSFAGDVTSVGTTVLSALQSISKLITETEYVVIVLTIAEKPKTDSGVTLGSVEPSQVLAEIAELLTNNGSSLKVYGYTETSTGKKVGPNTTIKDVLNHMIVKVNANTIATAGTEDLGLSGVKGFLSYDSLPNTMLSYASMAPELDGQIVTGTFDTIQSSPIYWGKNEADLNYYYHQAQRTYSVAPDANDDDAKDFPIISERKAAIDDIIAQSDQIYSKGTHDSWFQIGIGGYRKDRVKKQFIVTWYDDEDGEHRGYIASQLNPYLLTKINEKIETNPSPVGVVLMNYCIGNSVSENGTTYTTNSKDLINAIIEMNGKFYLNRLNESNTTQNVSAQNAAYAVVGDDAF